MLRKNYDKIIALIIAIAITAIAAKIFNTSYLSDNQNFAYTSFHVELEREFFQSGFIEKGLQTSPITLTGNLHFPKDAEPPVAAVILQHGSGGNSLLKSWHKEIVAALNAHHIAVLVADSHSPRGLTSTANDQTALSSANRLLDATQALKALAQDSRIDGDRIAIAGDSYGAFVSMRLAEVSIIEALLPGREGGEGFIAHAMLYPPCNGTPQTLDLTGVPMLMLLGGNDDYTFAADCRRYSERIKQAGYDIEVHEFAEAYHGWLYNIPPVRFAKAQTFNDCRVVFYDDGEMELRGYGISTAGNDLRGFYDEVLDSGCIRLGAHVGSDRLAREESNRLLVDFFVKHLHAR